MLSLSLSLSAVGAIAAVIAALPVVKSWLPVKLSRAENSVLRLVKSNGLSELYFWPVDNTVNVPGCGRIPDEGGIAKLVDKGMVRFVKISQERHGNAGSPHIYIVTRKGTSKAKGTK